MSASDTLLLVVIVLVVAVAVWRAEVYFRIADRVRVTYEVADVALAMDRLVATSVRAAINPLDRATALTSRGEVERQLVEVLREATGRWGVAVTRGAIRDLSTRAQGITEDSTSTVRRD